MEVDNKVPRLKIIDNKAIVDGHFNFSTTPIIYTKDLIPIKKISFDWCVEISQAEVDHFGEDELLELFAERLKEDFLKEAKLKT